MHSLVWIVLFFSVIGLLGYHRASRSVFAVGIGFYLILLSALSHINLIMMLIYWVLFGLGCVVLFDKQTQQKLLASVYKNMGKLMPTLSATERAALESGTVGWEGQLFAGMPNWSQLLAYPKAN